MECPECLAKIDVPDDVLIGEILECPDCGIELEVCKIEGRKVEVRIAASEEEDWGE
ncbi:lysine biosynthesis protein LysW [Candidatus Geothermarchaeota archaeon]|nr:MAG: lysine biosynthesis protein LysW [Candidatus Geothermarchaeota archaeon]